MKLIDILLFTSCFFLFLLVIIFLLILFIPDILPEGTDITFAYITNIGAIATVLVAIAAFLTIKAADDREKRREEREKSDRDIKEIIEWAEGTCKIVLERLMPSADEMLKFVNEADFATRIFKDLVEMAGSFRVMSIRSNQMIIKSKEKPKLSKAVIKLSKSLKKHINSLENLRDRIKTLSKDELGTELHNLDTEYNGLEKIALKILEEASSIS